MFNVRSSEKKTVVILIENLTLRSLAYIKQSMHVFILNREKMQDGNFPVERIVLFQNTIP